MLINGVGAIATLTGAAIITSTKFLLGAWIVVLLIPLLVALFMSIHRHSIRGERERTTTIPPMPEFVVNRWWEHLLHNQT